MQDEQAGTMDRRTVLAGAAALGAAATGAVAAGAVAAGAVAGIPAEARAQAAATGSKSDINVHADGTYDFVPLPEGKDSVSLCVVQTRVRGANGDNPKPDIKANLAHMIDAIDAAMGFTGQKDILSFHEFPITGYNNRWTREQALRIAIEVPGEETEQLSKVARDRKVMIIFGSYVKDPKNWPNHLLSNTTIIGPDGTILDQHWKARNIRGNWAPGFELFTTTTYDVLDKYVEMYGADAVCKVTRTPFGNIVPSSTQREPEFIRACAMKGAEIFTRTATGGFDEVDMIATSLYNDVYTSICNNATSPDNKGFLEGGFGNSAIYDRRGKEMAKVKDPAEQQINALIPLREYRKTHRIPMVHEALVQPVFQKYVPKYPPNLFSAYLPTDGADSFRYLKDKAVWK